MSCRSHRVYCRQTLWPSHTLQRRLPLTVGNDARVASQRARYRLGGGKPYHRPGRRSQGRRTAARKPRSTFARTVTCASVTLVLPRATSPATLLFLGLFPLLWSLANVPSLPSRLLMRFQPDSFP